MTVELSVFITLQCFIEWRSNHRVIEVLERINISRWLCSKSFRGNFILNKIKEKRTRSEIV